MNLKNYRWAGLAFLALSAASNFTHADETPSSPYRLDGLYNYFGFQGGVNFATLSGGGSYFLDSTTGFQVGVQMEVPFTPWFSLMPEVRYSQRGFGLVNFNASGTLDYVEVPVLAKFNMPNRTDWTPFVFVGPNFSFKVGSGGNAVIVGGSSANTFDFGLDSGVGVQYQMSQSSRIFVDFEYYVGFTDVYSGTNLSNSVPEFNIGFAWAP
jgi:hypothetical protein